MRKNSIFKTLLAVAAIGIILGAVYFYRVCYRNNYLTVVGPINYADGIGRQAIDFSSLVSDQVQMNLYGAVDRAGSLDLPSKIIDILKNKNKKLGYVVLSDYSFPINGKNNDQYLNYIFPKNKIQNSFNKISREEQIYIAYSMLETDMLPEYWVYTINKNWDMVVVPDKNLVDIYVNSGVKRPIFVVPLGVNLKSQLSAPLKNKQNKFFKFANFAVFEDKKNILKLVQAYHKAFKGNNQVRLYLAPRFVQGDYDKTVIDYIVNNNVQGVEIDIGIKGNDFYSYMFENIDCYVSPSKGEGFSIIPREAMARGIPTIVSDVIAQRTIADSGLVRVVHADKAVPGNYDNYSKIIGNFYDVEVSDLAAAMLDVYNNYPQYLAKSSDAREWAEKQQYKYLKEQYINMVKPKRVILGDRNEITEDYLMTNSKDLYDKFMSLKAKGL